MKKVFTLLWAVFATVATFAQTEPAIELQAEVDGNQRALNVSLGDAGKVQVDWGDGNLVSYDVPQYDGWNEIEMTGTVVGEGKIKVYGNGIVYFGCTSRVDGAQVLSLDVTKATALQKLYANANKLTSLDLTHNVDLTAADIQNNQLSSLDISKNVNLTSLTLSNNLLTSIDISANQSLATLYVSNNLIAGAWDISGNPNLKSLYALNNQLTSVVLGKKTASRPFFNFNNNKLVSIDATEIQDVANATLYLMGNQLSEVKLPASQVKTLNISKNNFTLGSLPATTVAKTLTYAPQNDLVIDEHYAVNGVLDLSDQTSDVLNTSFAVLTKAGTALVEGTDYTVENGKITFLTNQDAVYVTMTSAAYPKFTGSNIYKTTLTQVGTPSSISVAKPTSVKIEAANGKIGISGLAQGDAITVVTASGAVVANLKANGATASVQVTPGLYIINVNGKTVKVVL